jgi:hypothetical protein
VVDMNGIAVYRNKVNDLTTYTVNCEKWARGDYVITISDGGSNSCSATLEVTH